MQPLNGRRHRDVKMPSNPAKLAIVTYLVIYLVHAGSLTAAGPNLMGLEVEPIGRLSVGALNQILGGSRIVNHHYVTADKNLQPAQSHYASSMDAADYKRVEPYTTIVVPSPEGNWVGSGGMVKAETTPRPKEQPPPPPPKHVEKPVVFPPKNKEELSSNTTFANDDKSKAQRVILYTGPGLQEVNVDLYGRYCPDLRKCFEVSMDNAISSVKLTGVWVFFSGYSYDLNDDFDVEWAWGEDYVHEFKQPSLNNNVSSIRFIGHAQDFTADSLTLFSGKFFRAWEYFATDSESILGGFQYQVQSAAVTGKTPWTLYEFEHYEGLSKCLYPWRGGSPGLYPIPENIGMTIVRSVRKGCFSAMRASPTGILADNDSGNHLQNHNSVQSAWVATRHEDIEGKTANEAPTYDAKVEKQPTGVTIHRPNNHHFLNVPFLPQISLRRPLLQIFQATRETLKHGKEAVEVHGPALESTISNDSSEISNDDAEQATSTAENATLR